MEAEVDALYQQFVRKVAAGRGLEIPAVEAVAGGRVWTGADAATRGLVDDLGDVHLAITRAKALAKPRPGEQLDVEDLHPAPRRRGLVSRLLTHSGP